MAWPNPNEYVEAIQNPKQAFSDYELQNARVVTNRLGLPRPISGNFATVFEVDNSVRKWAVRCFLREVTNQQQRYAAITTHLKKHKLDCTVGFEYLPQGIKVKGRWYPILKMDWTPGSRLDIYLETNLQNPQKIQKLAEQWVSLCKLLRHADIAHGDLQHGNILVTSQDEIKLIDYDGVFISEVIGLPSNEIGHRHYQHPTRTSDRDVSWSNYRNIDNFSAHVIALSLLALSIDGTLWQKTKAGEENLLFRDTDYSATGNSATLGILQKHSDERIRSIAQQMQYIISSRSYLDVPAVERLEVDGGIAKDWLEDHLTDVKQVENSVGTGHSSWILDHLEIKPMPRLEFPIEFIVTEKQVIEAEFQNSLLRWFRFLFRQFAYSRIAERFSTYPIASDKLQLEENLANLEKKHSQAQTKLKTLNHQQEDAKRRLDTEIKRIESDIKKLSDDIDSTHKQEKDEIAKLDENQLEQHYQSRLAHYDIAPNKIPGIGPARISALNSVGIYNAAHIIPANKSKGLSALAQVRNSYSNYEWGKLEQWREQLKQSIPKPFPKSSDPNAARKILEKYADLRRDLIRKRDEKKHQLNTANSSSTAYPINILKQEINKAQVELSALEWRIKELKIELKRYEKITHANLLDLIINS